METEYTGELPPHYSKLRELALAATQGPWKYQANDEECLSPNIAYTGDIGGFLNDADGEFVAAANPQVILALLQDIADLRAALAQYKNNHQYSNEVVESLQASLATRQSDIRALGDVLAQSRAGQGEVFAYAYRYPYGDGKTVIRFSNGEEINGSRPIEAIPLYTHPAPQQAVCKCDPEGKYGLAAVMAPQQGQVPEGYCLRHWRDVAYNGLQWLENIADGVSEIAKARDNMRECIAELKEKERAALAAAPAQQPPVNARKRSTAAAPFQPVQQDGSCYDDDDAPANVSLDAPAQEDGK